MVFGVGRRKGSRVCHVVEVCCWLISVFWSSCSVFKHRCCSGSAVMSPRLTSSLYAAVKDVSFEITIRKTYPIWTVCCIKQQSEKRKYDIGILHLY